MSDPLEELPAAWVAWAQDAAATLGVDAARVDITRIHALTKVVAHELGRPMAPVSSFLLGMALADPHVDAEAATQTIIETLPR